MTDGKQGMEGWKKRKSGEMAGASVRGNGR